MDVRDGERRAQVRRRKGTFEKDDKFCSRRAQPGANGGLLALPHAAAVLAQLEGARAPVHGDSSEAREPRERQFRGVPLDPAHRCPPRLSQRRPRPLVPVPPNST